MSDVTGTYYAGNAEAIQGYGAELMVGDGATPENFGSIWGVTKITFGAMTTAIIDATHLRSPEAHREKKAGLRDSGPIRLEAIWNPKHESQSNAGGGSPGVFATGGMLAKWRTRAEGNYILRVNDGSPQTEVPFRGVVSTFQPGEVGVDGIIPVTIEITPLQDFSASLP